MDLGPLFKAVSKFQSELSGAAKNSNNPFFKSKYADLESVWEAIREPLAKNGLCVIQTTEITESGSLAVVTTLGHESGAYLSGKLSLNPTKNDPQGIGSAISYARRYALAAITGVYQTDDDAEAAHGRNHQNAATVNENYQPRPRYQSDVTDNLRARVNHLDTVKIESGEGPKAVYSEEDDKKNDYVPMNKMRTVTEPQLKRMFAISMKRNWSQDDVRKLILDKYNKLSTRVLTQNEYEEIVKIIETSTPEEVSNEAIENK